MFNTKDRGTFLKVRKYISVMKSKLKIGIDFYSDFKKYLKYSYYSNKLKNEDFEHMEGIIIRLYHGIEKGLSVSKLKPEFGLKNIALLQSFLIEVKKQEHNSEHIKSAITTLKKYYEIHAEKCSPELEKYKKEYFDNIFDEDSNDGGTKTYDADVNVDKLNYRSFFSSRHSIREFAQEHVDDKTILSILDIAKNCPSACNRQAMKILYSTNISRNSEILLYQNGSRTFRDSVPGVFIVCSDTRYQEGTEERNLGFIEGGIWVLSLVNAIHYMKLGSCVLNWCVRSAHDKQFHEQFNIPEYFNICAMIAFGKPIDAQKTPYSIRRNSSDFLQEIV